MTSKTIEANRELLKNYWRPYQKEWLEDRSRFKICLKSRQIGMSEALVFEAILLCLQSPFYNVYVASISLREAKELIRRATIWAETILPSVTGQSLGTVSTATQILFPNKSRIQALPADKIRSRSGTIILDEFAFMPRADEVWAAIAPATEARPDLKVIIVSTPLGDTGMYHEIWQSASNQQGPFKDWSTHRIDVIRASQEGFPVDPEELKTRYPRSIYEQEFMCSFGSDEGQVFSTSLILKSIYDTEVISSGVRFVGVDWAESHDASIASSIVMGPHFNYVSEPFVIKEAGTHMDYSEQDKRLEEHLKDINPLSIIADGVGTGSASSQVLKSLYPTQTRIVKNWKDLYELIPYLKKDMEDRKLRLNPDRQLIRDFRSLRKTVHPGRPPSYDITRVRGEGHGDRFFATLLAYDGLYRYENRPSQEITPVLRTRSSSRNRPTSF